MDTDNRLRGTGVLQPFAGVERARRRIGVAMLASLAASLALLVVLLASGFGAAAFSIAAGTVLFLCLGSCATAAVIQDRAMRQVEQAARELASQRQSRVEGRPVGTQP